MKTKPVGPEMDLTTPHIPRWRMHLAQRRQRVTETPGLVVEGQLTRMVGLTLEAAGCIAPIGARCLVVNPNGAQI